MTRLNIPVFIALATSLLAAVEAYDTLPHQRMIRKRAPAALGAHHAAFVLPHWPGLSERADLIPGLGGGENGGGGNPSPAAGSSSAPASSRTPPAGATPSSPSNAGNSSPTPAPASSPTPAASSPASPSPASPTPSASSSAASPSPSGGLLGSLTGILGGSSSTTSSTASSTTSSTSSTSSTTTSNTPAAATPQTTPTLNIATPAPTPASDTGSMAVVSVTTTLSQPEASAVAVAEQKQRTMKIAKNTIISLVVIAACIGGAIAIWTVIRKWKLSPSEKFDDRMQPIDWAPTAGSGAAGAREETMEEKRHRRAGSGGSHGSFTSGGVGRSDAGHGTGARSVYSDQTGHGAQQAADFPPAHDFTAGAAANYGQYPASQQYGYADLQRGPSVTESNYSHGASVARGMSYSRSAGGYEAQPGAGGMPPLPNPYGGGYEYEGYERQAGQGQYRGY